MFGVVGCQPEIEFLQSQTLDGGNLRKKEPKLVEVEIRRFVSIENSWTLSRGNVVTDKRRAFVPLNEQASDVRGYTLGTS